MNRPVTDAVYPQTSEEWYATRRNDQRAYLLARLSRRKLTLRKCVVYAIAMALLIWAQPAIFTFMLGSAIAGMGLFLRIWSFGHLEKNQELITTGPFAYTRNPAYLGSALVGAGLCLAAGNAETVGGLALWALGIVGLGLFFMVYLPRKYHQEYIRLSRLFPQELERHARHVPHFIPRLTPWRSGSERRFSWALVWLNHELVWPLTCLVTLGLMWV